MPDPTVPSAASAGHQPDPRLLELARQRRLYAIDRADGRVDLLAGRTPNQPAGSTAELSPVATVAGRLDGLVLVATRTAGAFLVVDADDMADKVEEIADAALVGDHRPSPERDHPATFAALELLTDHLAATVGVVASHADGMVDGGLQLEERISDVQATVAALQAAVRHLEMTAAVERGEAVRCDRCGELMWHGDVEVHDATAHGEVPDA